MEKFMPFGDSWEKNLGGLVFVVVAARLATQLQDKIPFSFVTGLADSVASTLGGILPNKK